METRLAAVMAADIVGYTRLMGYDQEGTLRALLAFRSDIFGPTVARHDGIIVKNMGDGWLVEFASAGQAVASALELQEQLQSHASLKLRIGINLGDIVREQEDIFGDGVNIAARLQEIALPGGVALSGAVHDSLDGSHAAAFADAGLQDLKNVARPVQVWMSGTGSDAAALQTAGAHAGLSLCRIVLRPPVMDAAHQLDELADGLCADLSRSIGASEWLVPERRQQVPAGAYVLDMQLRRRSGRLRLDARLEAPGGEPVWSRSYDGDANDSFDWQDHTGQDMTASIIGRVLDAEMTRLWDAPEDLALDEQMKRGLFELLERSGPGLEEAAARFARVAARDPASAAAHLYALRCTAAAAVMDHPMPAHPDMTEWLAGLEGSAMAGIIPTYRAVFTDNTDSAAATTTSGPIEPDQLCFGGWSHLRRGQSEAGISALRRFLRQGPFHPLTTTAQCGLAIGLVQTGQDYGAIEQAQTVLRGTTDFAAPYRALAAANAHLGRMTEAEDAVTHALRLCPGDTIATLRGRSGFAEGAETDRFFDGLLRSGYPER